MKTNDQNENISNWLAQYPEKDQYNTLLTALENQLISRIGARVKNTIHIAFMMLVNNSFSYDDKENINKLDLSKLKKFIESEKGFKEYILRSDFKTSPLLSPIDMADKEKIITLASATKFIAGSKLTSQGLFHHEPNKKHTEPTAKNEFKPRKT